MKLTTAGTKVITDGHGFDGSCTTSLIASPSPRFPSRRQLDDSLAVQVDMTHPESITAMVEAALERYGRIDVLVNNAGRALRSCQ